MNKKHLSGFTLVELLVGISVLGIILLLVSTFFSQSTNVSLQSSSRAELQQEVLNAQQIMAAHLKSAWYIYPPNSTLSMSGNGPLTANAHRGGNVWQIGRDPIAAMILLPLDPAAPCTTTTNAGCFRFVTYYAIPRDVWVNNTRNEGWRNPGVNVANDKKTWVLAQYRSHLNFNIRNPPSTAWLQRHVGPNGQTNILADFIAPTSSQPNYQMFQFLGGSNVSAVTINLAAQQTVGRSTMRLPGDSETYSITAQANNIGRIPK